jgi:hypothetical protein
MTSSEFTPQERLAASRKAIIRNMSADQAPSMRQRSPGSDGAASDRPGKSAGSMWQTIRRAARLWWNRHPAQLAYDVAKPLLGKYAEEKPYQLLGIAAAVGAAAVLARPWRLVSLTGLAVAALKSSHVSGLFFSLLSSHPETSTNDQPK